MNSVPLRPRILQVIGSSAFGGATRMILAVSCALKDAGYRVSVLTSDADTQRAFGQAGVAIVTCRHYTRALNPAKDILAVRETVRLCRDHAVDILHTHTSKGGAVGRVAGRILRLPVVHTVHGYPFHEFSRPLDSAVFRTIERLCAPLATRLVFVNSEDLCYATGHGWIAESRCRYIPNGVPIPSLPEPVADHGGRPVLVTVGRLSPPKGYHVLLRAFQSLRTRYPGACLWFVGDGELRSQLESQAAALSLAASVRFLGFQSDPPAWLSQAHVAVSSSLWEGLPVAVLEMMAANRPIVATACRGTREVIRNGIDGLLVPPGDADALADALIRVIADPPTGRRLAAEARRRVETGFSEERMVRDYLALYADLLGVAAPADDGGTVNACCHSD